MLLPQSRMKLHCIIIPFNSSAKIALASGSKNTSIAARTHRHRSDVEVISDLSGSNLMIRKRLGHKRGDETSSYALSASSQQQQQQQRKLSYKMMQKQGRTKYSKLGRRMVPHLSNRWSQREVMTANLPFVMKLMVCYFLSDALQFFDHTHF